MWWIGPPKGPVTCNDAFSPSPPLPCSSQPHASPCMPPPTLRAPGPPNALAYAYIVCNACWQAGRQKAGEGERLKPGKCPEEGFRWWPTRGRSTATKAMSSHINCGSRTHLLHAALPPVMKRQAHHQGLFVLLIKRYGAALLWGGGSRPRGAGAGLGHGLPQSITSHARGHLIMSYHTHPHLLLPHPRPPAPSPPTPAHAHAAVHPVTRVSAPGSPRCTQRHKQCNCQYTTARQVGASQTLNPKNLPECKFVRNAPAVPACQLVQNVLQLLQAVAARKRGWRVSEEGLPGDQGAGLDLPPTCGCGQQPGSRLPLPGLHG